MKFFLEGKAAEQNRTLVLHSGVLLWWKLGLAFGFNSGSALKIGGAACPVCPAGEKFPIPLSAGNTLGILLGILFT